MIGEVFQNTVILKNGDFGALIKALPMVGLLLIFNLNWSRGKESVLGQKALFLVKIPSMSTTTQTTCSKNHEIQIFLNPTAYQTRL